MDAWGLRVAVLLLAGIGGAALQLQQPALRPGGAYASVPALAVAALTLALLKRPTRWLVLTLALALTLFAAAGLRASSRLAYALPRPCWPPCR